MAATYDSRMVNGEQQWRLRTKISVLKGSSPFVWSPYLWLSLDNATNDEPLFRYMRDRSRIFPSNRPKIPEPPYGKEWFVSITPDHNWQEIRNYLESDINMVTPAANSKRKYKCKKDNVSETYKNSERRKEVPKFFIIDFLKDLADEIVDKKEIGKVWNGIEWESNGIEIVIAPPIALLGQFIESSTSASLPSVQIAPDKLSSSTALANYIESKDAGKMRKPFQELKPRRQAFVQNVIVDAVKGVWKEISPKNSLSELQACLANTELDFDNNSIAVIGIRNSYQIALKNNNKSLMEQILSMFCLNKEMTITKLSNLMGIVISYPIYRNASHHAQTHGPGAIVAAAVCHRNVELKYEIIEALVEYCIEQGTLKVMWNIIPS
jgi:hypothetical protein